MTEWARWGAKCLISIPEILGLSFAPFVRLIDTAPSSTTFATCNVNAVCGPVTATISNALNAFPSMFKLKIRCPGCVRCLRARSGTKLSEHHGQRSHQKLEHSSTLTSQPDGRLSHTIQSEPESRTRPRPSVLIDRSGRPECWILLSNYRCSHCRL